MKLFLISFSESFIVRFGFNSFSNTSFFLNISVIFVLSSIFISFSFVQNLDLLFKEQLEIKCEYLSLKKIIFKENLEDKREYATLIGLLLWPVSHVADDKPLIGIKKSFTENFSNIWRGFFE